MRLFTLASFVFVAAANPALAGCGNEVSQTLAEPVGASVVEAVDPAGLQGDWLGMLDVGAAELRLVLKLQHDEGGLSGEIVSIDQGGARMALSRIVLDGRSLHFESVAPAFSYTGEIISEDRITGVFTQNGRDFPLTFDIQALSPGEDVASTAPTDASEVQFTALNEDTRQSVNLAGTLRAPQDARAGVVILSGSGPQDRDGTIAGQTLYAAWADLLADNAIASLRLDDRGVGGSERVIPQSPGDLAWDAAAALDHLRRETGLSCVGYIGHSEGGWIALLAAPQLEPDFVISMAGMHEAMEPTLLRQSEAIIRASGGGDAAVNANRVLQEAMFEVLRTAQPGDDIPAALETALLDAGAPANLAETQAAIWGQPYAAASFQMDPGAAAAAYPGPLLALFGGTDTQVLAEPTSAALLASRPGADTRTVTIEGVDHLFQDNASGAPGAYGAAGHALSPTAAQVMAMEINALLDRTCR